MHSEKAKEFFSEYLEGHLDEGLKQSFEQRLNADPDLKKQFDSFAVAYRALGKLQGAPPEPDFDLHDKIMARVDRARYEQKQKPVWFQFNWRVALAGGVASLALLVGVVSFWNRQGPSTASMSGPSVPSDRLSVRATGKGAVVSYQTTGNKTIVLRSVDQGQELVRAKLNGTDLPMGQLFRSPIEIDTPQAALVQIDIEGTEGPAFVAVPGRKVSSVSEGSGSVQDLILALAERYRVPVVLSKPDATKEDLVWNLAGTDSVAAATKALQGTSLNVEMRPSGVLWIQ